MNRRIVPIQELPTIYLKPGEMHFGLDPVRVVTVLGSCISIIMYHRKRKIGAICHAVMPGTNAYARSRGVSGGPFHYVDTSIAWMLSRFSREGIRPSEIDLKVFGGSDIFTGKTAARRPISVGRKNIEAVLNAIQGEKLTLRAWDVGGNQGRKVIFYTDTGEVFTLFLSPAESQTGILTRGGKP